jgi:hypothetical protein
MGDVELNPSYELSLRDLPRLVSGVSDDFTLLDLLRIVRAADAAQPRLAHAFCMPCIDACYDEATRGRTPGDDDCLSHLELYWSFDYDVEDIPEARRRNRRRPKGRGRETDIRETPERGGVCSLMCFHGVGRDPGDTYAIWLTPLNDLARLPVRVNALCEIRRPSLASLRHPVRRAARRLGRVGAPLLRWWDRRAGEPIMTIEMRPTLHTLISSVFWELTFAGPHPSDREAQSKKLDEASAAAKLASERGELIPMDDMLDDIDADDDALNNDGD